LSTAGEVRGLEGGESDGQVVTQLQPGVAEEVGEALALLLAHVVAVGLVRLGDGVISILAADPMARDRGGRVADIVVVGDRVCGLGSGSMPPEPREAARAGVEERGRTDSVDALSDRCS
jgi:hypothetical protein